MARNDNRKDLEVVISVDRVVLGYLAAVTKQDPQMVMVNLRDMSNVAVERLQNRDHGRKTWTIIQYPNTEMKIRATASISYNSHLSGRHHQEYEDSFKQQTGAARPTKRKEWNKSTFWEDFTKWQKENPYPYKDYNYDCLMVEFEMSGRQSYVVLTQNEIDTILVEQILLAPPEEDDGSK